MKKILIPTDFSKEADLIMPIAAQFAKAFGAEVYFLHVSPQFLDDSFNFSGPQHAGVSEEALFMMKYLERVKEKLSKRVNSSTFIDIKTHGESKVGEMYPVLRDYADEIGADLIMMSSQGASGVDDLIIGSNAERVVRLSNVPVLVVKGKQEKLDINNILFATNGEEEGNELAQYVKSIAKAFGSSISLVNVNTPNNFYRTRTMLTMLEGFAKNNGIPDANIVIVNDSSEEDGILYAAETTNADIIIMGTHGRTGLAHLLSGSIAEDVVNHVKLPVLTYKFKKK